MKLHTLAPHESRMCPIDLGFKRTKIKVIGHSWLKMVSRLCKPTMIMKFQTPAPYESRMYLFDFWVKGLGLLAMLIMFHVHSKAFCNSIFASLMQPLLVTLILGRLLAICRYWGLLTKFRFDSFWHGQISTFLCVLSYALLEGSLSKRDTFYNIFTATDPHQDRSSCIFY